LDRQALPAPVSERASEDAVVLPRTETEAVLAGIWSSVLGMADVGVQDNFFAVGGQSLLAIQVISRIRSLFGVQVPVRALFEAPTIAELGGEVERAQR